MPFSSVRLAWPGSPGAAELTGRPRFVLREPEGCGPALRDIAPDWFKTPAKDVEPHDRRWPGLALALALHLLACMALFPVVRAIQPEPTATMDIVGEFALSGFGGGGGDGRESGVAGGGSAPAERLAPDPAPPMAKPVAPETAEIAPPPLETPPQPVPTTPEPPAKPEEPTFAVEGPETPPLNAATSKPKVAPPTRLKDAPRVAKASRTPAVAPATGMGTGSGTGTAAGDGPGAGHAGEGPGQGLGKGEGPGLGEGSGAGGGGEYQGTFGQGDGPKFRHRVLPRYPDEARAEGREGRVSMRLRIDADGVLRDVSVVEHSGLEFVDEALRAVKASSYHPAMRQGRPIPCNALLTIRFKQS